MNSSFSLSAVFITLAEAGLGLHSFGALASWSMLSPSLIHFCVISLWKCPREKERADEEDQGHILVHKDKRTRAHRHTTDRFVIFKESTMTTTSPVLTLVRTLGNEIVPNLLRHVALVKNSISVASHKFASLDWPIFQKAFIEWQ